MTNHTIILYIYMDSTLSESIIPIGTRIYDLKSPSLCPTEQLLITGRRRG